MLLFAIETSTTACSVALSTDEKIYSRHKVAPREHTKLLLNYADELIKEAGVTPQAITHIAYSHGPGSFTGIRLATSVTQGIAFANNAKTLGISSLQVLAQSAYAAYKKKNIAIAVDARKNEIYWGCYQLNENTNIMESTNNEMLLTPDKVSLNKDNDWLGIGDAWTVYASTIPIFKNIEIIEEFFYPHASDLLTIAKQNIDSFKSIDEALPLPVYMREEVTF